MGAVSVTAPSFAQVVLEHSQTQAVVVYFWATWCAPCRQMGPLIEQLADAANGRWVLRKVATEQEAQLTEACRINSLPALQLYKSGGVVAEIVDIAPRSEILAWLEANL